MILEEAGEALWICEGKIVDFHSFPYPTRAVVARLESSALWVWSPVRLTPELREAVTALGPVTHLVSPNKIHHLYLAEWKDAFPEARLWGPGSTVTKRKDLPFEAPLEDEPPSAWAGEIDQAWFRGSLFMDEIVFFHVASGTAIIADLSENFSQTFLEAHWTGWRRKLARHWGIVEGYGYAPLEWRLSWLDRRPARAALGKMLAWQPEAVVMAHGEWQRTGGAAYLQKAFAWLQKQAT